MPRLFETFRNIINIKIYKIVILPVVLYGCETWSLTLREEHKLRVSENKVLRRIFGPKKEEDGSWRKMHKYEFHSLYSLTNIVKVIKSRRMGWARQGKGVYRVLVGRPEGKNHLGVDGRITLRWTLGR
jgi:hypothetical protein